MYFSKQETEELRALHSLIGNNIHKLRLKRKITLKKLSNLTGLSAEMLDSYEMGKYEINLDVIYKIANAFKVRPEIFLA